MEKIRVAILKNENPDSVKKWIFACENQNVEYIVIDLASAGWLEEVRSCRCDIFLLRPPGLFENFKKMYDERIYIISKVLGLSVYPSFEECYIYENKILLSYFLDANCIPHAKTFVFYNKQEALSWVESTSYPIVAKTSIGASGAGVRVIRKKDQAKKYIKKAFSKTGIKQRFGPNRVVGSPSKWLKKAINSPSLLFNKLKKYFQIYKHGEKDYVLFQEYIPHDFEWRAVKIGDSYFAHKKIKFGDKASGSKGIDYVNPPISILNYTKEICDKYNFNFMAIDLFEDGKGGYLVNELQTIFGHVQDHILEYDGVPGRYIFNDGVWTFEKGNFNTNESYDLRLKAAIELFKKNK